MSKIYFGKFTCINLFFSLLIITVSSSFTGCKKYMAEQSLVKASEWISKAEWSTARTVTLTFKENPYGIETSSPLVFNAGQPYILKIVNTVGNRENIISLLKVPIIFLLPLLHVKHKHPLYWLKAVTL